MVEKNKELFNENNALEREHSKVLSKYQLIEDAYAILQEENKRVQAQIDFA
jgi:hypothetical protein